MDLERCGIDFDTRAHDAGENDILHVVSFDDGRTGAQQYIVERLEVFMELLVGER